MERHAVLRETSQSIAAQGCPHETEGQIHTHLHGPKQHSVNNNFIVGLLKASTG